MEESIPEEQIQTFLKNNKIALYSCNFGNFRNELKNGLDKNSVFDDNIDYYFYTDNKEITSTKWNIVYPDKIQSTFMDENRMTFQLLKLSTPKEIKDYDILIWMDSKCLPVVTSSIDIARLFLNNPGIELFNLEHQIRGKSIKQEIRMSYAKENKNNVIKYLNDVIKDFVDPIHVPDTGKIIRLNNDEINNAFNHVYSLINKYQLKRDQNVYTYALSNFNFNFNKLKVLKCKRKLRPTGYKI